METSSLIHDNVTFGKDCSIGHFCTIGVPPKGHVDGQLPTVVGDRANVRSHAVVYAGNVIGDDCTIGHSAYVREKNQIGDRVNLGAYVILEGLVTVGNDVTFAPQSGAAEYSVIGNGVMIGVHAGLASVVHPLSTNAKDTANGPTIGDGVYVGDGACIKPGLRIGAGAYLEPGAIVVRDVAPLTVVGGNPAKPLGDVWELHPEAMDRISQFVDVSPAAVEAARQAFAEASSLVSAT
jgi:acetyltransferase-like isoleucine patch superfamily enzyme